MVAPVILELALLLQAPGAVITGTVLDGGTGRPIVNAIVELPDLARRAYTDDHGVYTLRDVAAGPQHVAVSVLGYGNRSLHALVPRAGRIEINFALEAEPIPLEAINVRNSRLPFDERASTSRAEADRTISAAMIRNHPMLSEPDALEALRGGDVVALPESPDGLHVGGGATDQTAFLLDGIPILGVYHAAGLFSAVNPDAVAEVRLYSTMPPPSGPGALAGVADVTTRSLPARVQAAGSLSTTQTRLLLEAPVGGHGAGVMFSARAGLHGAFAARGESTYLDGETGDLLARVDVPVAGGAVRAFLFGAENEVGAAVSPEMHSVRNELDWQSQTFGATWSRRVAGSTLVVRAWRSESGSSAEWALGDDAVANVTSSRVDRGFTASIERLHGGTLLLGGLRFDGLHTLLAADSASDGSTFTHESTLPIASLFGSMEQSVAAHLAMDISTSLALVRGHAFAGPRVRLRWMPSQTLMIAGSAGRAHQYAQSVRNAESVAGNIYPADLWVAADGDALPVADADQAALSASIQPVTGLRIDTRLFVRRARNVALAAPRTGLPFAVRDVVAGDSRARGASAGLTVRTRRYGLDASWGWQRLRYAWGDSSYVPVHGSSHNIEAGIIVFPGATSSIRVGMTGITGRRATAVPGPFEWEACNLLDGGCEFVGSPDQSEQPISGRRLPGYLRVDVGARKHWHVQAAGRTLTLALFGTVTNVFGRTNLLTWVIDPGDGSETGVTMRPFAPLVLGLDWQF